MPAETVSTPPEITDAGNTVQIGPPMPNDPNVFGTCEGSDLAFSVFPGGDQTQTYAWVSLDSGSSWDPLTNNRTTLVESTGAPVQWQVNMQAAGGVKFLIFPGAQNPRGGIAESGNGGGKRNRRWRSPR